MNPRPALYERAALPLSYSGNRRSRYQRVTARHEGVPAQPTTNICAMNALAGQVWHYWLAVPLTIVTVLTVAKLVAGYVQKVVAPRYPKR